MVLMRESRLFITKEKTKMKLKCCKAMVVGTQLLSKLSQNGIADYDSKLFNSASKFET